MGIVLVGGLMLTLGLHSDVSADEARKQAAFVIDRIKRGEDPVPVVPEDWGMVPEGYNPCRSVDRYPQRKRARFLTADEFARLGRVLDEVETGGDVSVSVVAAIRLLMLTGCRKSEILTLRWEHVAFDAAELTLPDSKTGARVVTLSPPAVEILSRELTALFRGRIGWDDGAIRDAAGAGAVAFLMNRCCRSGEDVGARAPSVGKRWGGASFSRACPHAP